ncbi:hypothetical protein VNO77_19173 [Canavalia gladiata]|uniref:Uncharacterized protein n=1 Tax=Canavalia gladiata TaxID=3824 RepID=A0AAN9LQH9_CANGL
MPKDVTIHYGEQGSKQRHGPWVIRVFTCGNSVDGPDFPNWNSKVINLHMATSKGTYVSITNTVHANSTKLHIESPTYTCMAQARGLIGPCCNSRPLIGPIRAIPQPGANQQRFVLSIRPSKMG